MVEGFIKAMRNEAGIRLILSGRQGTGMNAFVLLYIISMRCRFSETKDDDLKPGQCYISTHEKPLTRQQTRSAIINLESANYITTKSTNNGTVATLINSDIFDINISLSTNQVTSKSTTSQPRVNQRVNHELTTKEERKNVIKNERNNILSSSELDEAKGILEYLNQKANRSFRPVSAHLDPIRARLNEAGVTAEGVRQMIDVKCADWLNDRNLSQYLRPQTLFRKSKFAEYYDNRNRNFKVISNHAAGW